MLKTNLSFHTKEISTKLTKRITKQMKLQFLENIVTRDFNFKVSTFL